MLDASFTLFPEDKFLGIFPPNDNTVRRARFSDDWMEKVDDWAHKMR